MNPWTDSFEEYRQTVIGEANKKGYKKSAERWQDDDGDGKWYEKSDTDGKISKREKKEKAKHYKEDMSKDKEGHTTGGFRISNKEAKAAKGRLKDKVAKKREQISTLKKEEVEQVDEKISASGYARAKKYREAQAAKKDRDDNAKWEEKDRTHKWDGKTWNKRDKPTHEKGTGPHARKAAEAVDEGLLDNLKAKVNKKLATAGRNFKGGSVSQMGNYAEKSLNSEEAVDEGKKKGLDGKACWDGYKLSGTKKKGGKTVDNCVKEDEIINNIDGTTTEIIDVIKAPKMVAAPKFSNWREDFVWDEPVDEALKTPKLDIDAEKGKVKNKIEVNPTVETEAYDNTKSPDYKKKKKALAKKHGGAKNIKGHPQFQDEHHQKDENGNEVPHQLDEIDSMGGKVAAGLATGVVAGGLRLMGAAKNAANRIKQRKSDAMKKALGEEKKNFDEAQVKYYSGKDRNPNTGLPKNLKASPVKTEREVDKKLDYKTMSQSYEPEGESIIDEGLGDAILGGLKKVDSAVTKASNTKVGKPIAGALKKVFGPWKSTDGGSNRTSPTAASQKAKGLRTEARGPQFAVIPRSPKKQKEYDDRFNKWLGGMKPSKPVPVGKKKKVKESVEGMAALQKAQKAHLGIKSNPFGLADITAANNAILKKQGLGHQMTADGQNINFGATARAQFDKVTAATQDPAHASKLKDMGTSAAQMKRTGDELGRKAERNINKYIPGTFAHQADKIETDIAFNTAKFKPKNNSGFKLGVNSYEPKGDVIDELNRYEKETGTSSGSMNMPKGRKTKKGGTSSPVMRAVRTSIRKETGKPHGQQKKTKGEKGNRQPGDRKTTPADSIAKRRESRADAEKLMRDTRGT